MFSGVSRILFGCEDFVNILGVITTLDYSKHLRVKVKNGYTFWWGPMLKLQIFAGYA